MISYSHDILSFNETDPSSAKNLGNLVAIKETLAYICS